MMIDQDKELTAITALVNALTDLDEEGRLRVLDYVAKRFRIGASAIKEISGLAVPAPSTTHHPEGRAHSSVPVSAPATDIRALKEEKQPSSAIQMTVLVAYYLKSVVSAPARKEAITAADIEKYFNEARYPLPKGKNGLTDVLNNSRRAGYLESAGRGAFRLNSVGFNLAAYNMPTESKKLRNPGARSATTKKKPSTKRRRGK
jgi:hypothetical protein